MASDGTIGSRWQWVERKRVVREGARERKREIEWVYRELRSK